MTPRLRLCLCLGMVLAVGSVRAAGAPVRIAVIGDAGQGSLASLVTVELSHHMTVSLVEREDLAKVGDELELKRLARSDAVALGKMIGADGLLFLGSGPAGLQVRFTAVGLGYVLFDDRIASPAELPQLARLIAHRVGDDAPKLKLDPAKAIPVSLLNLRAVYATAESTALERKLTLLLESSLASLPEYVVLERRHAWSVAFERSLESTGGGLLHGAYIIDGTLETPAHDTAGATVHLRIRTPGGQEINSTQQGLPGDIPALVGKMVVEISKATGGASSPPAGQTRNEADEYLQEGLWGWRHSADEAALEALDSADLLGANIADVTVARIGVLAALVNQGLEHWYPMVSVDQPSVDDAQIAPKVDHALRALQEVVRYRDEKLAAQIQAVVADNPRLKGNFTDHNEEEKVIYPVSKLLVLLDQTKSPRADAVREALRAVTGYDPLNGKTAHGFGTGMNNGDCSEVFVDSWARNMEEEWAYCRLSSTDRAYYPFALGLAAGKGRGDWNFCSRFVSGRANQQKAFDQFAQSLHDDPDARLTYLLLQTVLSDQATADAAFAAFLDDLWQRRDALVVAGFPPEWVSARFIPKDVFDRHYQATLPLLHYDLTHANSLRFNSNARFFLWRPENWSAQEAAEVWKDYAGFKERATRDWAATHPRGVPSFSEYETPLLKKFPQLTGPAPKPSETPPAQSPLVVTRFWHPWRSTSWPYDFLMFTMLASDDDGVWLEGSNPGQAFQLFRVGLPDFTTRIIPLPERRHTQMLAATRDAVYMAWDTHGYNNAAGGEHQLARYDLATSQWAAHDLPAYSNCYLYNLENTLYLFLQNRNAAGESAITRYDWVQDKLTVLSSTRRRPAQNQFDDRQSLLDARIFTGPGHRPCVNTTMDGTFFVEETPTPWPKVFESGNRSYSVTDLGKTLVFGQQGNVTLLDPAQAEPELLLAPAGDEQAVWNLPKDEKVWYDRVCQHDDCLFILDKPKVQGGPYDLLCYQRGKGKDPRHVPLEFRLDEESRARLSVKPEHAPVTWNFNQIEHPDTTVYPSNFVWFRATARGLYLQSANVGFWFLPYGEIDTYLKTASH